MEVWQPIETAPRDGRWILAGYPTDGGKVVLVYWNDLGGWWDVVFNGIWPSRAFTHWQPWPDSPAL
jgi:hypothetical protein